MPLTPKNRKEQWLEGLVDHETTLTPKNRCEAWMKEIIDASGSGGGGGTGGGVLVVTEGEELPPTLSETWQTIHDAMASGKVVILSKVYEDNVTHAYITEAGINGDAYQIFTVFDINNPAYIASSADDYPVMNMG